MNIKLSVIIFLAIASPSVNAQPLTDFSQMNSSGEFFDRGNEQLEQEIKQMQDGGLLKIKLPDAEALSPNDDNLLYTETDLVPSEGAIDNLELN